MADSLKNDGTVRIVTAKDLPLHCPTSDMPLWSQHPRVFLDVEASGQAVCPYCGYRYVLQGRSDPGAH